MYTRKQSTPNWEVISRKTSAGSVLVHYCCTPEKSTRHKHIKYVAVMTISKCPNRIPESPKINFFLTSKQKYSST